MEDYGLGIDELRLGDVMENLTAMTPETARDL